jgi:hypothetical protein
VRSPPNYRRAASRILFLILLVLVPLLPPLTVPRPRPEFIAIREAFTSISLTGYLALGVLTGVALVTISGARRLSFKRSQPVQRSSDALWTLPIEEAVQPQQGGNGLASRALDIHPLSVMPVYTPGMECVVLDGRKIIRRTARCWSLSGTASARRVLLTPKPRQLENIRSLSKDQLETCLSVAITYRLIDPTAALVQAPLEEFTHLAQGVIIEHIHSHNQHDLLNDRGGLRKDLEARLREAKTLAGFQIVEVSVLSADGDRRLIEVGTQTRIETLRGDLVKVQGSNRVEAAGYDIRIDQLRARLSEWAKTQAHGRLIEKELLRLNAENVQAVVGAITAIAQQGSDAGSAVESLTRLMTQQTALPISESVELKREPEGEHGS